MQDKQTKLASFLCFNSFMYIIYIHKNITYMYCIYIIYILYTYCKARSNELHSKMVLEKHLFIKIYRFLYRSFVSNILYILSILCIIYYMHHTYAIWYIKYMVIYIHMVFITEELLEEATARAPVLLSGI